MKWINRIINFVKELIPFLFIILWAASGASKLMGLEKFQFELGRSPYLEHIAGFVSIVVPIGELVIAGLLIFKPTKLVGMYASFFLLLLFTGYIYMMLNFSYYTSCSCGGVLSIFGLENDWKDHLKFNIVATIIAVIEILLLVAPYPSYKVNNSLLITTSNKKL